MKTLVALVALGLASQSLAARERPQAVAPDVSGTYTLVQVNGQQVPATLSHDGASTTVQDGAFTLSADGACRSRTTFVVSGQEATRDIACTYGREGAKLTTFKWTGAGVTTGTVDGKTLTMDNEGVVLSYKR